MGPKAPNQGSRGLPLSQTSQSLITELIPRLSREHAADRHEEVVPIFHSLTPAVMGNPALLVAVAEKALDSARRLKWVGDLIQIHQVAGISYSQIGDATAAEQHLTQALAFAQQLDDLNAQARALAQLGQLARHAGDTAMSRQRLTAALTIYQRTHNRRGQAQALGDLGNLEDVAGHIDVAMRRYLEALPIFTDLDAWSDVAKVHRDVRVCLSAHDLGKALAHGLLAVAARVRAADPVGIEGEFWDLAAWVAHGLTELPDHESHLREWWDEEQAAGAGRLFPELELRAGLHALSALDPEEWERRARLVADPAAEQMLRRAAGQLTASDHILEAMAFEALANAVRRAQTVGPYAAAQEELTLRERVTGKSQMALLAKFIDVEGDVDVAKLDAIAKRLTDPLAVGVVRMLAGRETLEGWQVAENGAAILDEAIRRLEGAATALGPTTAAAWWLEALSDLGSAYRHRINGDRTDNHERAIDWLRRASEAPLRPETVMGRMACQINLANALLFRVAGDPAENVERAIELLEDARRYAAHDPETLGRLYMNLGLSHLSRQCGHPIENEEEALRLYELAFGLILENQSPIVAANLDFNIGMLYSRRASGDTSDNEDAALTFFNRALQRFDALGWDAMCAEVRQARAMTIARLTRGDRLQNLDLAIAETVTAIAVMQSLGRQYEAAGALNNLGNLLLDRADLVEPKEANDVLQKARRALEGSLIWRTRQSLPIDWARTVHNLANVHRRLFAQGDSGSLQSAIGLYRQALTVRTLESLPVDWAQTVRALAIALLDSRNLDDAAEAEALLEGIIAAGEDHVGVSDVRDSWAALGDIAAEAAIWSRAAECYGRALELEEARLTGGLLPGTSLREVSAVMPLFMALADAQAQVGDALDCALTLERSRTRLLSDAIERDRRDLGMLAEADAELHSRYVIAASRVRDLGRLEAADLRPGILHDIEAPRSRRRHADVGEARRSLHLVEDEVRQLPGFETFLEPFGAHSLARVVETRGPVLYISVLDAWRIGVVACWFENGALQAEVMLGPQGGASAVLDLLLAPGFAPPPSGSRTSIFLAHTGQADWADVDIDALCSQLGLALPRQLWEWLQRLAPERLTLVPCGPLMLAPLHALVVPGTPDERLIDRCTVAYAPSARTLARLSPIKGPLTRFSFYGDPEENLCDARREVEELSGRFPTARAHLGPAATRAEVLAGMRSAEVLHFAGHGGYNPERPLQSGLKAADGLVTLADVYAAAGSGEAARLVTLSACDTAVIDMISAADEAIGLPSAFLAAGVDGVIASLWPVEDRVTAELMGYLYEGLVSNLDPPTALRDAQRRFRAAGSRPAQDWAAFIYLGA